MSPPLDAILSRGVQDLLRREIEGANGSEVFFLGRCDPNGVVIEVEVAARGNRSAVPALLARAAGFQAAIHNHPSGDLTPTPSDLRAAGLLSSFGLGFLIVDDAVERAYEAIPVPRQRTRAAPPLPQLLDPAEVAAFFREGGPLARVLGDAYEPRPAQVQLAEAVAATFREEGVGLFEAGTGTGKTFAYLVPAALQALRTGEKVLISTATKNLQSQLTLKDVPALADALDLPEDAPLKVAIVKGRSNFVSLRRAQEAIQQGQLAFEGQGEQQEVVRLAAWARETRSGDKAELSPPPSWEAWDHVVSTSDNCLGRQCPRFRDCHFFEQRRLAHEAHVVVANHHLLFADLAIKLGSGFDRAAVLPPFKRVVLDEAHHVEDIASEYFGLELTEVALTRPLGRLELERRRGRGLLPALQAQLRGPNLDRLARTLEERLRPLREDTRRSVEDAFRLTTELVREGCPAGEREAREVKMRVGPEHAELFAPLEDARASLVLFVSRLGRLLDEAKAIFDLEQEDATRSVRLQIRGCLKRLERGATGLEEFLGGVGCRVGPVLPGGAIAPTEPSPERSADPEQSPSSADPPLPSEQVRWIELFKTRRRQDRLRLRSAPLQVGPHLVPALFSPAKSVVLTSATLATGQGTEFLQAQLGLGAWQAAHPERRLRELRIPSPFDFPRQVLLGIPSDLPLPNQPGFGPATTAALRALLETSRGRAFALFTSFGALQRAYDALAPALEAAGMLPLRQGSEDRQALLDRFKATRGAVLFGTDSFWEGVDVPGDALVLVVIAKLPFGVPSEPLQLARAEAVEARGGSPFSELALPQAVLKLKQGFGRLIRNHADRGAVIILDRRVVTRAYGRAFLDSLPAARIEVAPLADLLPLVARMTQ
ncbi:MAG: DEAD/DEAH box helicase family protein [Planctomycetes bacterium]|nr:DEAD/DEAH box helicase family protein [Planctomycetota bacterium]